MIIHKEGLVSLAIGLVFVISVLLLLKFVFNTTPPVFYTVAFALLIFFLLLLQFFRNPEVKIPYNPNQILAPAEGKVVVIEQVEETEFLKEKRIQVSIFMSPLNIHVNRNPIDGIVKYFKYHPGEYLVAWHPKSSTLNERTTYVIETDKGATILLRQIAGALARRICWYVKEGDKVKQGDEFGFIKFGSRVDLYLPLDAKIKVKIGDLTSGGQTVIAEL